VALLITTRFKMSGDLLTGHMNCYEIWLQVFIGHSDTVTQAMFTANNSHLITVGEGILCWSLQPLPIFPVTPLDLQTNPSPPRHTPPKPSSYKPIVSHTTSFLTPCGNMDHVISGDNEEDHVSNTSSEMSNEIIFDHVSSCVIYTLCFHHKLNQLNTYITSPYKNSYSNMCNDMGH